MSCEYMMKRLFFFVILLVLTVISSYREYRGADVPPTPIVISRYSHHTYTTISRLAEEGYTLDHILRVYDSLGFVQNSRTASTRLKIIDAYNDSQGGVYGKRMEGYSH